MRLLVENFQLTQGGYPPEPAQDAPFLKFVLQRGRSRACAGTRCLPYFAAFLIRRLLAAFDSGETAWGPTGRE